MSFFAALLVLGLTPSDTTELRMIAVTPAESLAVTQSGTGEPVVMLPGMFGSSYAYRHVMRHLTGAGYHSIGIEPLGMGSSNRPREADYSLNAQTHRVATVLDSLGVRQAVFIGHSLGASIAMRVAVRRPELVRGIVSIEGGPGETAASDGFRRWMRFAPVVRMLDGRRVVQQMLYREMRKVSFDESWVEPGIVVAYTTGLARDFRATIDAYRGMADSEEPELLAPRLPEIGCPVRLLVAGHPHDSGPSDDEVQLLAESLTAFRADTIPETGYFIQEEQPEVVAAAVLDLASGPSCAPTTEVGLRE